jgi:hypothetical protein
MTKPSKALTPAGAQLTERHLALLKLANRTRGVSIREAYDAIGITQKCTEARFAELIDEGLAFRAMGFGDKPGASRCLRWFGNEAAAKAFSVAERTGSPGSVAALRYRKTHGLSWGVPPGVDYRYSVDQSHQGEFMAEWRRLRGEAGV